MNLLLLEDPMLGVGDCCQVACSRYRARPTLWPPPPGRTLTIGLINGPMGTATVEHCDQHTVRLVITALDRQPPAPLPVTLVLALPRPKMLRRVLHSCSELGVKKVHLINSYRVEKSYWQSPLLAPAALRDYLIAGLEQACDTVLPTVQLWNRFKPFVEDTLPTLCAGGDRLLAHPAGDAVLPLALNRPATLVIGPEGGFTGYEVDMLAAQGFSAASLGARVLRVETAVPALLARLYTGQGTGLG